MTNIKDRGITFDKPDKNKKFGKRENMSKERISNDYKKEEEFNDSDKTNDDFLISTDSEQNNEIDAYSRIKSLFLIKNENKRLVPFTLIHCLSSLPFPLLW